MDKQITVNGVTMMANESIVDLVNELQIENTELKAETEYTQALTTYKTELKNWRKMMDRYEIVYSQYFHGSGIGKKENGAYILYEDCKLRVEALSELLKNAEREAEEFRVKCVELEVENAELKDDITDLHRYNTFVAKNNKIAKLKKQLKIHKRLLFKVNKELDLYKNRGYSARKVRGNAIRKAAEVVAAKLQKENLPTVQALAMGRMYVELLTYADEQEKDNEV